MNIRDLKPEEAEPFGQLLVEVYSRLEGFPSPVEQPAYYESLKNVGQFAEKPNTRVIVAVDDNDHLLGGLIYFGDMAHYGSGGTAPQQKNASGIRLLGVNPDARGQGVASELTQFCIDLAKYNKHDSVILHTTRAMQVAWKMYANMGFKRDPSLDFSQKGYPVFGFRLTLN